MNIPRTIFGAFALSSAVATLATCWRFDYDKQLCVMAMCTLSIIAALLSIAAG